MPERPGADAPGRQLFVALRRDLQAGQDGERVVEDLPARLGSPVGRRLAGRSARLGRPLRAGPLATVGRRRRGGPGRSGPLAGGSRTAGPLRPRGARLGPGLRPGEAGSTGLLSGRRSGAGLRAGRGLARGGGLALGRRPHRERDLLLVEVHLEHAHLDAVARLERGLGVLHEPGPELRDVDEAVVVDADVDEGAEVRDVAHDPRAGHPGLQVLELLHVLAEGERHEASPGGPARDARARRRRPPR